MEDQNYYRISIKGVVVKDGKYLLPREDNGKWELMGGGIDHGEDPHDCLRREIKEETGLEVTWISEAPLYFLTCPRLNKPGYIANVIYQMELANYDFTPSNECQELGWFTPEDMKKLPLFPNVEKFAELLGR